MNKESITPHRKQKMEKPKIMDLINVLLKDDKKHNAIDFVEYLKTLKMTPQWASTNFWALSYKSKREGYIKINENGGDWTIWCYSQYDKHFEPFLLEQTSDIREFIMNNIVYCYNCSACSPGKNMVLLGKELKKICATPNIRLTNPNGNFLDFAKKKIILRRSAVDNNRVPSSTYIKISDKKNEDKIYGKTKHAQTAHNRTVTVRPAG